MNQKHAVELWRTVATLPPHDIAAGWALEAFACAVEAKERERCAAWVDARLAAFCSENGSMDPDTGAIEFGRGANAQAKEEYVGELAEIAEGLRALGPNVGIQRRP